MPREHFRKFHMKPKKNEKFKTGFYEFDHENTLKFDKFKAKKLIFRGEKIKFKNFILSQIVWEAFLKSIFCTFAFSAHYFFGGAFNIFRLFSYH